MNIPRYWAKCTPRHLDVAGTRREVSVWGWSDASPDDAQRCAAARAITLAQNADPSRLRNANYASPDQPLREEIADTLMSDAGERLALITRNAYGALVLNAAHAMFIDLDFPEPDLFPATGGFFR